MSQSAVEVQSPGLSVARVVGVRWAEFDSETHVFQEENVRFVKVYLLRASIPWTRMADGGTEKHVLTTLSPVEEVAVARRLVCTTSFIPTPFRVEG